MDWFVYGFYFVVSVTPPCDAYVALSLRLDGQHRLQLSCYLDLLDGSLYNATYPEKKCFICTEL
jgi:hypothetical protein